MGKIKSVLLVLLTITCLFSCEKTNARIPDYTSEGYICEISWEQNKKRMRAAITAEAISQESERDIKIEFSEPKSLDGISIIRKNGETSLLFDDIEINGNFYGFLEISKLLEISGESQEVSKCEIAGELCTLYRTKDGNGEEISIFVSDNTSLPTMISGKLFGYQIDIYVIRFEKR